MDFAITAGHSPVLKMDIPGRSILRSRSQPGLPRPDGPLGGHLQSHEVGSAHSDGDAMKIRETILKIVECHGVRVFLVDASTGNEITYRDFHRQACALAAELRERGVRKGDRGRGDASELAVSSQSSTSPAFILGP